jgi:hypothetical protein
MQKRMEMNNFAKSFFEALDPEDRKVFHLDNPLQAKRSSG